MTKQNWYDHNDDYGMYDDLYFEVENDTVALAEEQDVQLKDDADLDAWLKEATAFHEQEKKKLGVELRKLLSKKPKKERDNNAHLKSISWNINRIANVLEEVTKPKKSFLPKKNMGEYISSGQYLKDKEAGKFDEK
jgi:hypothetical protein